MPKLPANHIILDSSVVLSHNYVSYANALDLCDVNHLSAQKEQHSLKFAQSLPKCSWTSKLLP